MGTDNKYTKTLSKPVQMAGPHGMVELDDFCIPYDEESCTFRVKVCMMLRARRDHLSATGHICHNSGTANNTVLQG